MHMERKGASARTSAGQKWHADKAVGVAADDNQNRTGVRQYHKTLVAMLRSGTPAAARQARLQRLQTQQQTPATRTTLTARQKYWRRRARLLAGSRQNQTNLRLKQKMARQSDISVFDVSILFTRASKLERKCLKLLRYYHSRLSEEAADTLKTTANGECCTEEDLEKPFGVRLHSSTSETYFWEQSYRLYQDTEPISIDDKGQARLFTLSETSTRDNNTQQSHYSPGCV